MEYPVYWLLKSSCFELSGDGNTVFFELKSWWKDDIYWLLESCCFELFGGGKYGLFLSQKVDGKMIFTWSSWAFYDIPGFGKYSFSRSVWVLICTVHLTVCYYHATHAFQSESKLYSYLNVKELLACNRYYTWSLSDSNGIDLYTVFRLHGVIV